MSPKLQQLIARYLEIEEQYLKLTEEVELLKQAIKAEMKEQGIKKTSTFEVTTYHKNTIKTSLFELSKVVLNNGIDSEIVLDKTLQSRLGSSLIEKLIVTVDSQEVTSIKRNWK